MCILCDGATHDEALFDLHGRVLRHGWALQGVESGTGTPGWIYTVGLSPRFGHAELVVVGGDLPRAAELLNGLGAAIASGARFTPGDRISTPLGDVDVDVVHPAHVERGLVAVCEEYSESLGLPLPELEVLQVVPVEAVAPRLRDPDARWSPDSSP